MFPDKIKQEVKRKSAFRCCRCHEIGIDVHHIIPESQEGSNDIDNAAPLCQNCHDRYGNNPSKRTEIKQMRDWWYEVVKEKYYSAKEFDLLAELDQKISQYHQEDKQCLKSINKTLEELSKISIPKLENSKEEIRHKITEIINLGSTNPCSTTFGLTRRKFYCPFCSKDITLELEAEKPGITSTRDNYLSNVLGISTNVVVNSALGIGRSDPEILVTCPYCNNKFNINNAKYLP
ncbi:MAG: HNH endonuclease signature motif containing protein [Planctomycetota bacterium]